MAFKTQHYGFAVRLNYQVERISATNFLAPDLIVLDLATPTADRVGVDLSDLYGSHNPNLMGPE